MEELSSDLSSVEYNLSNANIRLIQSSLLNQIKSLDEVVIDRDFLQVPAVCDDVKDKILIYDDEPQLSKTCNNRRRIFIASELLVSICSLHENNVNFELTNTVNNLMDVGKFRKISRIIFRYMLSQRCKEKFFVKESKSKILTYPDDERDLPVETADKQNGLDRPVEETGSQLQEQFGDNLDLPRADPVGDNPSQTIGNLTEIRRASEIPPLNLDSGNISQEGVIITAAQPEVSIREPDTLQQNEQDISEIIDFVNDEFVREVVAEISRPDIPLDSLIENLNAVENAVSVPINEVVEQHGANSQEISDELNLSSLESDELMRPRRPRVIIDERTTIPHYAARALQLNRNIHIQRVQVFEGPPNVLQAVSIEHLMRTPGYRNSIFHEKKNGLLNDLYKRHLIVEKRSQETLDIARKRPRLEQPRNESRPTLPVQANMDIEEEYQRTGLRSASQRREVLSEIVPELSRMGAPVAESTGIHHNLNGMPLSRILRPTIESPPVQITAQQPIPPSPRVQRLQGKKPDPKISKPWFTSTRVEPPSDKWRNFQYISGKLQEYWTLLEVQGAEKSITILEFIELEGDGNRTNLLTLLRVLDKLSLQRKLLLEYKKEGILIKPFEFPYVSNKTFLLRGKEPKF